MSNRSAAFHVCGIGLALTAGMVAAVGAALADDGGAKLRDKQPAFIGPVYRAGDDNRDVDQFKSDNVKLLSWLPLNAFEGEHNSGNDCWGYVSPSGREYAIIGLEKGFGIVEVTEPANPKIVGTIMGPASLWHDVKVIGEYAYGVSEGGAGIQVIDMRKVDDGEVRLVQNKTQAGHSTTHNIAANPETGFLYLCGANFANGGLVAVSTADPENPTIVGAWSDMYVHDAQVVIMKEGPLKGREIAFCASGFGNGSGETGLRIVDVTDKTNMHTIGMTTWDQPAYSHQCWLSEDQKTLFLNDELDEQTYGKTTTTHIMDVSDPTNPREAGSFTSGSNAIDHNLYVKGQFVYEANYRSGLRVFDAADPMNPQQIAFFDTYPSDDHPAFNGAWSCYPYLPSGIVLISDIERGLFVVDVLNDTREIASTESETVAAR